MADKASNGMMSGFKSMSPQAKKGMLAFGIAVGFMLGGVAIWASKQGGAGHVQGAVAMAPLPSAVGDSTVPTSDEYRRLVAAAERKRFEDAANVPGQMVLPSMVGLTDVNARPEQTASFGPGVTPAQRQQANEAQAQAQAQTQTPAPAQVQYSDRQRVQYESMMKNFERIANRTLAPTGSLAIVMPGGGAGSGASAPQAAPSPQLAQSTAQTANAGVTAVPSREATAMPIISAGSISFATLDGAVNSDFSGPVVATLRDGKYKDARILGTKSLESDHIVVKFNLLSPADGSPSIQIDAYAIQISDAKRFGITGLSGKTDYHIFQRYVLPAAMVFAQTYGAVASQQEQTVIQTDNGIIQTQERLNSRDRMIAAAGSAAQPVIMDITRAGARPITQELEASTEIGVMFARDVVPNASQSVVQAAPQAQTVLPSTPSPQQQQQAAEAGMMYQQPYGLGVQGGYARGVQPVTYGQRPSYGAIQPYGQYQR